MAVPLVGADAAAPAGLEVYEAITVGVAPGRVVIPDVVVTDPGLDLEVPDAAEDAMVVASPSSAVTDRAPRRGRDADGRDASGAPAPTPPPEPEPQPEPEPPE